MSKVITKSVQKTPISKSVFAEEKYLSKEEFERIALRFSHPAIFGKGKILGDIISPLYKEVDE